MTTPHDTACELRGRNHFSGNRSCHCEFRALKAELVTLRAKRDAAQQEIVRLKEDRALNAKFYAITIDQRNKAWAEHGKLIDALRSITE